MFKLITGGHLFSPDDRGVQDILIFDEKIAKIGGDLSSVAEQLGAEVISAEDRIVTPGFMDQHVHFLGGGDYEGPAGATTDIEFSSLTRSGITTAVGCLGSEDVARNMLDLVRRARDLEKLGITTYVYSGSFNVPSPTITGSVRNDVTVIDKVLGVKFAISEAMASFASLSDLAEVAKDSFLGGLIGGKKGVVHIHVGRRPERMDRLFDLLETTGIPVCHFVPTHVNRSDPDVLDQAVRLLKMGGTVDLSAIMSPEYGSLTGIRPDRALSLILEAGAPIDRVTMSSDGNVSMPILDEKGNKTGLTKVGVDSLYRMFLVIVENCEVSFSDALKVVTLNVARTLGLQYRKGSIEAGKDADLLLLEKDYRIDTVFARGRVMVKDGREVVRGYFE
ncbi:MAG: beta-aspartyl-peptidase [Deltaproteobacteria bacterium]|nr:beta-aspartyl-peptidase [Deltaproteobacteria bacterium]